VSRWAKLEADASGTVESGHAMPSEAWPFEFEFSPQAQTTGASRRRSCASERLLQWSSSAHTLHAPMALALVHARMRLEFQLHIHACAQLQSCVVQDVNTTIAITSLQLSSCILALNPISIRSHEHLTP